LTVSPELLALLVCPACKKPVELTADGQGLRCTGECKLIYPIHDGFPVMIKEEARSES
jgi:uncharacterized protein